MEGFIYLHRKMLDWEWYDDINTCRVFLHCLFRANWKPCKWHGVEIEAGQFITSLQTLANETGLSVRQIRTALEHLISTGEVTSKSHNKFRIITVNNWERYQAIDKQDDKQPTKKRQRSDKQPTTDEERNKEIKKINKYYPGDENLDKAFSDYVSMRKQIKKPMSDRAVELAMKKLDDLSAGDKDTAIAILNQSIMNSWQGLFELKRDKIQKPTENKFNNFSGREYDYTALENEAYGMY